MLIALLTGDINLARVTQRVLRELKHTMEGEKLRQQWQQMHAEIARKKARALKAVAGASANRDSTPERNRGRRRRAGSGADAGDESGDGDDTATDGHPAAGQRPPGPPGPHRRVPGADLIKKLGHHAAFKMLENPVVDTVAQPVCPDVSIAYGGEIGQWGNDASQKERLGTIVVKSDQKKTNRSILRLHLHTLTLGDHPLFSQEERKYTHIRRLYSQYSAVFEQRTTGYLSYRLYALVLELMRLVSIQDAQNAQGVQDLQEDDVAVIRRLYRDLLDTLPMLTELRCVIDAMSESIYDSWRELQVDE